MQNWSRHPPGFEIIYIGFNISRAPFDDRKFRQALNYAEDKELIANEVLAGRTLPGYGILPPGFPGYNPGLEVIFEMWRANLGVDVEIQQVEWASFLADQGRGEYQAFAGIRWVADYPDPHAFLDILFHSGSNQNFVSYSDHEVNTILEAARVEQDATARAGLYRVVEEMIVRDAPWLPLWHSSERYLLIKPDVSGYRISPIIVPTYQYIHIGN